MKCWSVWMKCSVLPQCVLWRNFNAWQVYYVIQLDRQSSGVWIYNKGVNPEFSRAHTKVTNPPVLLRFGSISYYVAWLWWEFYRLNPNSDIYRARWREWMWFCCWSDLSFLMHVKAQKVSGICLQESVFWLGIF